MGYTYLSVAIIMELAGTTFMKYSDGFTKPLFSAGTLITYAICFIALSKSLKTIELSSVYATWSGIGIVAATLLSVFIFKEYLNIVGVIAIIMILSGAVVLNIFGTVH